MKIKELIDLPMIRTVIQLSDIEDFKLRKLIAKSFLITEEVDHVLTHLLATISKEEGKGFFIEGNFGSGKSHLLSIVSLMLNHDEVWNTILQQKPDYESLYNVLRYKRFITLNISLVEHSNNEYLEQIVLNKLLKFMKLKGKTPGKFSQEEEFVRDILHMLEHQYTEELEEFLKEKSLNRQEILRGGKLFIIEELMERLNLPYRFKYNRKEMFDYITQMMKEEGVDGLVILMDELSEFLRSKPDSRRFNEDIRFLQFLGEYCSSNLCWVVATLQENIEKTGEITPDAFNKIKDRYPVRFRLTGEHVKELIGRRLIKKKPGAEKNINEIYEEYVRCFDSLPISREDFGCLYPVNPMTVDLLDNLKPLFSQHRGIVDFIHFQLKGDAARNIRGLMEESAYSLLSADRIFDHFETRIREMMETNEYYEKVYNYYRQEIKSLLPEDSEIGLKIVKLLILFAVSPVQKRYTVRDIAHMLLHRVTQIDPGINYEYVNNLLETLHNKGVYISLRRGENPEDNQYYLDLKADVNLIIQRKLQYIKGSLFDEDHRVFDRLGQMLEDKVLPLKELFSNPVTERRVVWQNTSRHGWVYFMPVNKITLTMLDKLKGQLRSTEKDFVLFIGYARNTQEQKEFLKHTVLPELGEAKPHFLFWIPRELENRSLLVDCVSKVLLLDEYLNDSTPTGIKIKEVLRKMIRDELDKIRPVFHEAYFNGSLITGSGEELNTAKEMVYLPFSHILNQQVFSLLNRCYPQHVKIAPYREGISREHIQAYVDNFLKALQNSETTNLDLVTKNVVENFVMPMGVLRKKKGSYVVDINPKKNMLLRRYFSLIEGERTHVDEIYWKLRKGVYGLSRNQFVLLTLTLFFSGYLTPYTEERKVNIKQISAFNFNRIKLVGPGELIRPEFQKVLMECSLIPARFKDSVFSLYHQHKIWEYLVDKKKDFQERIKRVEYWIRNSEEIKKIPVLDNDEILTILRKVDDLLGEIKTSYASDEGLERFVVAYQNQPYFEEYFSRFLKIEDFIQNRQQKYLKIKEYLEHPSLVIPEGERYISLRTLYSNLRESIEDKAVVYQEDFFARLEKGFEKFQSLFCDVYRTEHERKRSRHRFKAYHQVKGSKGYRVLTLLAGIRLISVKNDLVKVDRQINSVITHQCEQLSLSKLKEKPVCECGFTLEEDLNLISVEEIQSTIEQGILEYIKELKSPDIRGKIENYIDHMVEVGEKRFALPIRQLLNINTQSPGLLDELAKFLNTRVIDRINQVLQGDVTIVERNLDVLIENLVGRTFSKKQLKQFLDEWIEGPGGLSDKNYVRIISNHPGLSLNYNNKKEDEVRELKNFLRDFYPELVAFLDEMKAEEFALKVLLSAWLKQHSIKDARPFKALMDSRFIQDNSIRELGNKMMSFYHNENHDFLTIKKTMLALAEKKLKEDSLSSLFIEQLDTATPVSCVEILKRENIFKFVLEKAGLLMVKMLESNAAGYCEVKSLKEEIKKVIAELKTISSKQDEFAAYKECVVKAVDFYLDFLFSKLSLEREKENVKDWETLYKNHLSVIYYYFTQTKNKFRHLEWDQHIPMDTWEKQTIILIKELSEKFETRLESIVLKDKPLRLDELILKRFPEKLKHMKTKTGYLVLIDGMRWDTWRYIKEKILSHEPFKLRIVEEGSLFSIPPTVTEKQLDFLKDRGYDGEVIISDDFQVQKHDVGNIIKFDFVDNKLHTSTDNYYEFLQEIGFQVENRLVAFLKKIPAGSLIMLFSDHGYEINYKFTRSHKYEVPRYFHGGKSPFEVIVPWAVLYKS